MTADQISRLLRSRMPLVMSGHDFTAAAVLVPLQYRADGEHLVLTRRASHLNHHQGQIAFPGGKIDPLDLDPLQAALRESHEEIGLRPKDIRVLGQLDQVTAGYNFIVTPFVGMIPHPYPFAINPEETAEVFTVPVAGLLRQARFKTEQRPPSSNRTDPIYHFYYDGRDIWGATARIIKQFLELVYGFKAE
ncbi:MAG TPA: CoA pyrophosphatase [Candidatus Acidoferrales bacterium]|nr:CoA pyrophosphatase [Candidatus Acidoferrales bacterium]